MQEHINRLKQVWQNGKGRTILIACGFAGIALLAIPELLPTQRETSAPSFDTDSFVEQTENRLTALVSSIEGVGKCRVMVTLENGVEYVYATEERRNSDRQEDVSGDDTRLTQRDDNESAAILIDTETGREGLLVTEIQPTVRGVVVVCDGGDNETVRHRISEAVSVALNISSKRVCITK